MLAFVFLLAQTAISQEGMPIYSDYLTDNYYLIHPSMAGAANCAKVRVTGRQQWFGDEDAPRLLTMSVNGRIGESNSPIAVITRPKLSGIGLPASSLSAGLGSKVSRWLGPPSMNRKMTLFALPACWVSFAVNGDGAADSPAIA